MVQFFQWVWFGDKKHHLSNDGVSYVKEKGERCSIAWSTRLKDKVEMMGGSSLDVYGPPKPVVQYGNNLAWKILREKSYDVIALLYQVEETVPNLTEDQWRVFQEVMEVVDREEGTYCFLMLQVALARCSPQI